MPEEETQAPERQRAASEHIYDEWDESYARLGQAQVCRSSAHVSVNSLYESWEDVH